MKEWIGLTIGEVLVRCGVSFADVQVLDEPPGKLRAVEFVCLEGGQPRRVVLEIDYCSDLFSVDRSWSQKLVEEQTVVKVRPSDK